MPEECKRRPRVKPIDRKQMLVCPIDVEKLIEQNHTARWIWEFVGELDLSDYYDDIQAVEGEAGRSAFDPQLLISLWLYAYSQGIGIAREIARRCDFDPAFQWLTGMQPVNYHTLADFRILHGEKLDDLFKQSLAVLDSEGLIELKRVLQDGTKISASAGRDSFHRENKIRVHLELAEQLLAEMEQQNGQGESRRSQVASQRAVEKRKESLQKALEEFKKLPKTTVRKKEMRVSETDPDARIMKQPGGGCFPAYNAQASVESKNGFIVGVHISQSASDFEQLRPGLESVSEHTGATPQETVVDSGYTSKKNIISLSEKGIKMIGPLLPQSASAGQFEKRGIDPGFRTDAFRFDEENKRYICPAGKELSYVSTRKGKASIEHIYRASASDCRICIFREKCCGKSKHPRRSLVRSEDLPAVVEFNQRMQTEQAKNAYKQRSQLMEFAFAWIKEKLGLRKFHVRGLKKAITEFLWVCLTYNIQQWIRLRRKLSYSTA